jgi:hypothetical protein
VISSLTVHKLREESYVDSLAEHFDRRALRADHVAADDPLDHFRWWKRHRMTRSSQVIICSAS